MPTPVFEGSVSSWKVVYGKAGSVCRMFCINSYNCILADSEQIDSNLTMSRYVGIFIKNSLSLESREREKEPAAVLPT